MTLARFYGATVFTDHFSRFIYVTLFQGLINEETLQAKHEYKRLLAKFGHQVKAYQADNSRFNSKLFSDNYLTAKQKLTFCGVGAHHQNGIGKAMIKRVVEDARISLLYAKRKWPKVITTNL